MARLNKIFCAEWDRKIRINANLNRGKERWVPGDPGGAWPINVYWYPAQDGRGPYLRFQDPIYEYFMDIRLGTTLLLIRKSDGSIYVKIISSKWPQESDVVKAAERRSVKVGDRNPVRKLDNNVASNPGLYIGRIEYPFNRFISKRNAPEAKLPEH